MTLREKRNHALGYGILFFIVACVYGFVAYLLFESGALKFGTTMTAFASLMAGLSTFSMREFMICRFTEREIQEIKKGKEKKANES